MAQDSTQGFCGFTAIRVVLGFGSSPAPSELESSGPAATRNTAGHPSYSHFGTHSDRWPISIHCNVLQQPDPGTTFVGRSSELSVGTATNIRYQSVINPSTLPRLVKLCISQATS